jgi:hypothetical protein
MPQSVFKCANTCAIDAIAPSNTFPNIGDVGVYLVGGTKGILRRALATFDLFGAAAEGRALRPTDAILLAELLGDVQAVNGPTFQVDTQRLTRADYVAAQATWNNYKTATPWTAAGGDVAAPPAVASFTSPASLGDQVIQANLAAFVTDALANRGGLVLLRWNATNENPGVTAIYTTHADPSYTPALRLRVTYADVTPTGIDRPGPATLHGDGPGPPDHPASPAPPARAAPAHPQRPATSDKGTRT